MSSSSRDHAPTITDGQGNPTLAASDYGTEWEPVAEAVMATFQPHADKLARKFADRLYEDFLGAVQDYLSENAIFNIAQRLESAERQRRDQWERAEKADRRAVVLEGLIRHAVRRARGIAAVNGIDFQTALLAYADTLENEVRLIGGSAEGVAAQVAGESSREASQ